jgi:uncharacterized protein YqhQ
MNEIENTKVEGVLMQSKEFVVTEIRKQTKAIFYKNLSVGSKIKFSMSLERPGRSCRGLYASYVKVTNMDSGEHTHDSQNQLSNRLFHFRIKEVNNG